MDDKTLVKLKKEYIGKEFLVIGNTERTVSVLNVDSLYLTVKVVKNKYSRQNCIGNYFPYVGDIVKYPLTALPVLFKVAEEDQK